VKPRPGPNAQLLVTRLGPRIAIFLITHVARAYGSEAIDDHSEPHVLSIVDDKPDRPVVDIRLNDSNRQFGVTNQGLQVVGRPLAPGGLMPLGCVDSPESQPKTAVRTRQIYGISIQHRIDATGNLGPRARGRTQLLSRRGKPME